MNYRELIEFTKKHPNPFRSNAQHDKEAEYRYRVWVMKQDSKNE